MAAKQLESRWKDCKAIPGTRKYHQFKPCSGEIVCAINSSYKCAASAASSGQPTVSETFTNGEYVLVAFNGRKMVRKFVGQVR